MLYVIGSGPSGVACAKALVERGEDVTMLDAGLELEEDRKEAVEKLRKGESKEEILEEMRQEMYSTMEDGELPIKLRYGSDYPYRNTEEKIGIEKKDEVEGSSSLGKGGLSTVWGAQVLPYRKHDIREWPIERENLAPYYRKILDFMPLTAEKDDLERFFPLYTDEPQHMKRSRQARLFMEKMDENKTSLNDSDIYFGNSRLALKAEGEGSCPHCGQEIMGCCPKGAVYDSGETLEELRREENFSYIQGVLVEKVEESEESVKIRSEKLETGEQEIFEGQKVFLACGAVPTTKIVLESLEMYNETVKIAETPYFVLPMLRFKGAGDVTEEKANTLSQLFLEIMDQDISDKTVHLQVYTYSDIYREIIKDKLGPLYHLAKYFLKPFFSRFIVVQGYLHSEHTEGIDAELTEEGNLNLSGEVNRETKTTVKSVAKKITKNFRNLGAIPLLPLLETKPPGESFHLGSSFPMSDNPSGLETDLLGRPDEFENVHIVDSSVLPEIPATTIVLSMMANSYRIGAEHDGA